VRRTNQFVVLKDTVCTSHLPRNGSLPTKVQRHNEAAQKYVNRYAPLNDLCLILNENLDWWQNEVKESPRAVHPTGRIDSRWYAAGT
jgi:hypothetical protein